MFGPIIPGVTAEYVPSIAAKVTSTAGEATLAVADPSSTAPGKLVNGTYVLESPLQVRATNGANPSTAFAPVAGSSVTADAADLPAGDQLGPGHARRSSSRSRRRRRCRAGNYGKSLTFTLSTTTP